MIDSELSIDLEWIQQAIDAIETLPLEKQDELRSDLNFLRDLKWHCEEYLPEAK